MRDRIDFTPDYGTKQNSSIIKVIGVGGGGGNAVKHMYSEGIVGVDFLICNTDEQALKNNVVPSKLVLGDTGLGAGANPEIGRELAENSIDRLKQFIGEETQMLFITAGMGKGTGTGAAPVVAKVAHDMGILTIGVVTFPFKFEGKKREQYAETGIAEMEKYVDSLIVVKNQKIMKYYGDEGVEEGFGHADDVLKNAVKCIAELITVNADQNIDFNDIKAIMQKSGHAMLGLAEAEGEDRINQVVADALSCPLLSEDVITRAQNFLFFISYGPDNILKISELEALTEQFDKLKTSESDVIWGRAKDDTLGNKIRLSVIITNYEHENQIPEKHVTIIDGEKIPAQGGFQQDLGSDLQEFFENNFKNPVQDNHFPQDDVFASAAETQPMMEVSQQQVQSSAFSMHFPQQQPVFEPEMVAEAVTVDNMRGTQYVPQRIGSADSKYDDNEFFNNLVGTPAILREKRQEDFDTQSRYTLDVDNDMADFFKDIPD